MINRIIAYSGGHSSAIVAIEVARRYPNDKIILLNHDISEEVEDSDIKRFKKEVADYLGLPITYCNYNDLPLSELPNQFEVCETAGAFQNPNDKNAICTNRLKTAPFTTYLEKYQSDKTAVIYYGFDAKEANRVERRESILQSMGYKSDYPLSFWIEEGVDEFNDYQWNLLRLTINKTADKKYKTIQELKKDRPELEQSLDLRDYSTLYDRTIFSTMEIGIKPPLTYSKFKHANCVGCLKGGKQHWYVVYCNRKDIFDRAKISEQRLGYTIINGTSLSELEPMFEKMKCAGVPDTEHIKFQTFWAKARKFIKESEEDYKPCECVF